MIRLLALFLVTVASAQQVAWRDAFEGADAVAREVARRRLLLQEKLPVDELVAVLAGDHKEAAVAAARLLVARHPERPELRAVAVADTPLYRVVLPLASTATLRSLLTKGPAALRSHALFALEDRRQLDDELLLAALRSPVESLVTAACQLVVFERSPFPIAVVQRLEAGAPRQALLGWLAERPRRGALPFVLGFLRESPTSLQRQVLAISALPATSIGPRHARVLLRAAEGKDLATGNRARFAAARLPSKLADALVPDVVSRIQDRVPRHLLLPCLERVSAAGERLLMEHAVKAKGEVQSELFHWLVTRDAAQVTQYVGRSLDGGKPIPEGMLRLVAPALTTRARIERVAKLVADREHAELAFTALLDAKVYHPAMLDYAADEVKVGPSLASSRARRLRRLLRLPRAKLPVEAFALGLESDSQIAALYAVNSLARGKIPRSLERSVFDYATSPLNPQLQVSAIRALVLWGSESAGRRAWAELRKIGRLDLGFRWLMERPKPWNHEILLKERERLGRDPKQRVSWHRVLITLAKLGDRGARQTLVDEIPRLGPHEMQEVQAIMGRVLKRADLVALGEQHLQVRPPDPDDPDKIYDADDRRVELLEWLLEQKKVDLTDRLTQLWREDRCYEIKLLALRGLLARDTAALPADVRRELDKPFDEARQEMAFEIVGSMTATPISTRNLELTAHILLRCPLSAPVREVGLSMTRRHGMARGAYPLITPIVNLLRLDAKALPRVPFQRVADRIGAERFALNRQRLGLFLSGIARRDELIEDLGPVIARLILAAPDPRNDYVGAAQMVLADEAFAASRFGRAARLYARAYRAFARGAVPEPVRRAFFGVADAASGYHPMAALAARAPLARAHDLLMKQHDRAGARQELVRARDLAYGDSATLAEIRELESSLGR